MFPDPIIPIFTMVYLLPPSAKNALAAFITYAATTPRDSISSLFSLSRRERAGEESR
jgi:hypothetical protein